MINLKEMEEVFLNYLYFLLNLLTFLLTYIFYFYFDIMISEMISMTY